MAGLEAPNQDGRVGGRRCPGPRGRRGLSRGASSLPQRRTREAARASVTGTFRGGNPRSGPSRPNFRGTGAGRPARACGEVAGHLVSGEEATPAGPGDSRRGPGRPVPRRAHTGGRAESAHSRRRASSPRAARRLALPGRLRPSSRSVHTRALIRLHLLPGLRLSPSRHGFRGPVAAPGESRLHAPSLF